MALLAVESWESKGTSEEKIENITKSDINFAPTFEDHHLFPDMNFNRHCLIKNISIPKEVINLYISYTLKYKQNMLVILQDPNKRFALSLLMEATVFYLLMLQKYINSKQKTQKQRIIHPV